MAQNLNGVREKIMTKVPLDPDLELHIRKVNSDGLELVDLRQWIPSLKTYGRGVMFEAKHLDRVLEGLKDMHKHVGVGNGSRAPGPGQGSLL